MGQRSSTSQFQQCSAHGQLSGLAARGQPGALQLGLGTATHRRSEPRQCPAGRSDGFRDERRRALDHKLHLVIPSPRRHAAGPRARRRSCRPRSSSGRRPRAPRLVRPRRRGAQSFRQRSRATSLAARRQRPTGRRNTSTRLLGVPSVPGRSGTSVEGVGRAWLSARSRDRIAGRGVRSSIGGRLFRR
jgi:hypothetical protein